MTLPHYGKWCQSSVYSCSCCCVFPLFVFLVVLLETAIRGRNDNMWKTHKKIAFMLSPYSYVGFVYISGSGHVWILKGKLFMFYGNLCGTITFLGVLLFNNVSSSQQSEKLATNTIAVHDRDTLCGQLSYDTPSHGSGVFCFRSDHIVPSNEKCIVHAQQIPLIWYKEWRHGYNTQSGEERERESSRFLLFGRQSHGIPLVSGASSRVAYKLTAVRLALTQPYTNIHGMQFHHHHHHQY